MMKSTISMLLFGMSLLNERGWGFTPTTTSSFRATRTIQKKNVMKSTILGAVKIGKDKLRSLSLTRLDRTAQTTTSTESPCLMMIHGKTYNMTAWAQAHPGGVSVLRKFHNRDATRAFEAAHHSSQAYAMLREFEVVTQDDEYQENRVSIDASKNKTPPKMASGGLPRWRKKLFTTEDPIGLHKSMGLFVLLHYLLRYGQLYFGDPSAGYGMVMPQNSQGAGARILPLLCLLPHTALSLSSLIFHTVPKERVVGKPMIWQEFRAHNIVFALRSIVCTLLAWWSIQTPASTSVAMMQQAQRSRRLVGTVGSGVAVLSALVGADRATARLRVRSDESTTATMPYWDGCPPSTQRQFKSYYAYCQFMATLACLATTNPAWAFCVMLPIQLASLLMTLVRKGLLSSKGYHYWYAGSLAMPFLVGIRASLLLGNPFFPGMLVLAYALFQLRRRGVNKYLLWIPVVMGRMFLPDSFLRLDGVW